VAASAVLLAFLILLAPIHALVPTVELPAPLAPHHQTAETLLYVLAFFVLAPVAAWLALRLIDQVLVGGNPALAGSLSAVSTLISVGVLVLVRVIGPESDQLWLLSGLALFAAVFLAGLWWQASGPDWPLASKLEGLSFPLAGLAGFTTVAAVISLGYFSHVDLPWLIGGLAVTLVVLLAFGRLRLPSLRRPWGPVVDLVVLVLIVMAVPDMVIFQGVGEKAQPGNPFLTYVIGFHQSLFLGPVSQILNGSALLVDTVAQYGVGSVYLLAAFFEIAPIGNGTLGFFDASLTALTFGAGYAILRLAGVRRILAAPAMVVAVVVLVWALEYPIGGLLQHGGLRFGLPMPLILFWVAAARFPGARRWLRGAGWAVVGLSAIWALEAWVYTTGALVAMVAIEAALMAEGRRRWLARQAAFALVSWVTVQVVFALATLIWAGALPDWGLYLTYLRDFLAGDVGDLTYDVPAWSPGLTVGFAYLVSALALIVTAARRPDWLRTRSVAAIALAGLAGYGILLYSYFDNRSLAHVIPYISLPLVLSVTLWLWLVVSNGSVPRRTAIATLGSVLAVAALSLATVMPAAYDRGRTSLLDYALPGGKSLGDGFHRLWHPPELKAGAEQGAALLARYLPGQDASPVITVPDLDNNILTLAGRANSLGITDAKEQSWVEGPHVKPVEQAAARLKAGDRVLVDTAALRAYRDLVRNPDADREQITAETEIADIQLILLEQIARRFRLRPVAGKDGLFVVELEPR
jgi:hypothetical protein